MSGPGVIRERSVKQQDARGVRRPRGISGSINNAGKSVGQSNGGRFSIKDEVHLIIDPKMGGALCSFINVLARGLSSILRLIGR